MLKKGKIKLFISDGIKKNSGNIKETWKIINNSLGRKSNTTI